MIDMDLIPHDYRTALWQTKWTNQSIKVSIALFVTILLALAALQYATVYLQSVIDGLDVQLTDVELKKQSLNQVKAKLSTSQSNLEFYKQLENIQTASRTFKLIDNAIDSLPLKLNFWQYNLPLEALVPNEQIDVRKKAVLALQGNVTAPIYLSHFVEQLKASRLVSDVKLNNSMLKEDKQLGMLTSFKLDIDFQETTR